VTLCGRFAEGEVINGSEYPALVLERELDETEFPGLEEARPHALEVAEEAHAPPEARPEDAKAVSGTLSPFSRLRTISFGGYQANRSSVRASLVAFFHSL
jgi:hypothetical protein